MNSEILVNIVQGLMCIISGILLTLGLINIKGTYVKKSDVKQIGTIVVDNSDENTNIFLELSHDDIDKWENGKDYYVRVEIRDYLSQK